MGILVETMRKPAAFGCFLLLITWTGELVIVLVGFGD